MKKTPLLIITGPNADDVDLFGGLVSSYGLKVEEKVEDYSEVNAAIVPLDQVLDVAEDVGNRGVSIVLVNIDGDDGEGILHQLNSIAGQTIDEEANLPENIYRFHKTDRNLERDAAAAEWFHILDMNIVLMEQLLMKNQAVESRDGRFGLIFNNNGVEKTIFIEPYDTIFMITQVDDNGTMPAVNEMISVVANVVKTDPFTLGKKIDDGEIFNFSN